MPALQSNALKFNPNDAALTEVATYRRRIHANLDRVWENVLDWEHLPWLHNSSFDYVGIDECGSWGWRTWSSADKSGHIELCVDKPNSQYVARSYKQGQQISEIWTRLIPEDDETDIEVSFSVPDLAPESKGKLGQIYLKLYTQLWDEDESMMQERQHQLTHREAGPNQVELGSLLALRDRLPLTVKLGHRDWLIREQQQKMVVHAAVCPHSLGPLTADLDNDRVTCPWHGYTFDVISGDCVHPYHAQCRLPSPPSLHTDPDSQTIILKM
ncbi:MAG: Rieske (2Fe-2S) protein [bacterium]|nr:Rieske (2Fe-2S) protein [Gammaproteobacteria bacterium]HIL98381.1 Rieske (2Fe-2S) protein [Pseudomonadales bacterium]